MHEEKKDLDSVAIRSTLWVGTEKQHELCRVGRSSLVFPYVLQSHPLPLHLRQLLNPRGRLTLGALHASLYLVV